MDPVTIGTIGATIAGLSLLTNLFTGISGQQAQREISEEGLEQQKKLASAQFGQNLLEQGKQARKTGLDQLMSSYRGMMQTGEPKSGGWGGLYG